jgi:selenocysteine-specific elongation factor
VVVVATAGHVDHGKSTLVRALTGMEPDRWAEERRRGMTIDLGYAWVEGLTFVDVPGHERFVANLLAGVGPVRAALLVVAADDGWAVQTEEHARALHLLGIEHVVTAVTRADRSDPAPVVADARRRMPGEVVAVSGRTGAGLPELRAALDRLAEAVGPAADLDRPRLWVDRAFSLPGAGPVVTGTLVGGWLSVGDDVVVGTAKARVAGVQSCGRALDRAAPGTRAALRLRGVDRHQLGRGQVVRRPGDIEPSDVLDVELVDTSARIERGVLHVGSAALAVTCRPLGARHARLRLPEPLPLEAGDRGVLREPGGRGLVAGVRAVALDPPPLTRRGAAAARARELEEGTAVVRTAPAPGAPVMPAIPPADRAERDRAERVLRALGRPFTLAEARDALGTSRSAALTLLTSLDAAARTVRRPDGTRVFVR